MHHDDFDGDCAGVESDTLNSLELVHSEHSELLAWHAKRVAVAHRNMAMLAKRRGK